MLQLPSGLGRPMAHPTLEFWTGSVSDPAPYTSTMLGHRGFAAPWNNPSAEPRATAPGLLLAPPGLHLPNDEEVFDASIACCIGHGGNGSAEMPEADALLAEAVSVSIQGMEALMADGLDELESSGSNSQVTKADQLAENLSLDGLDGFTTLMIRNLPHNLIQNDVVRELDSSGFQNLYDFLYMPSVFSSGRGKGYAFVNFVCPEAACMFMNLWHKSHRFSMPKNKKTLDISVACIQGRDANVLKWDDSKRRRVLNPNYRPVIRPAASPVTNMPNAVTGTSLEVFCTDTLGNITW